MMKIKTGDIIILWGKGWTSKLIAFCITSVFGVLDPPTHVEMAVDPRMDISAEKWKVKMVDREEALKEADKFMVIRHKKMDPNRRQALIKVLPNYKGKKYDVFLYVLWVLRLAFVLNPIIFWVFYPFRSWLKKRENRSYTCSELVNAILNDIGIKTGIQNHRNASPHHFKMLAACSDWMVIKKHCD